VKKIYLSPSNQEHNAGKGAYGTEEQRMHELAAMVAKALQRYGTAFATKISNPLWNMGRVCADSNGFHSDAHLCLHTNAGGGDGTVVFYGSAKGKELSAHIYKYVAPESPGKDEGLRSWPGLYEIGNTSAPVAYFELFFHDNYAEVNDYLAHKDHYVEAIVHGLCDWAGVKYEVVPAAIDYRPLKREAVKVAKQLGIPQSVDVNAVGKGAAFEKLLREIAGR